MPVPDFQSIMYPFLHVIADGRIYNLDEMVELLKSHFKLMPEDLLLKTPTGKQQLFRNRIGWARTYLNKTGLIEKPSRGQYTITELGKEALKQATKKYININFLRRFPEFMEWEKSYGSSTDTIPTEPLEADAETPDVLIEKQLQKIHSNLQHELLDFLKNKPADFFEFFVTKLLSKMGYGGVGEENFEVVGRSSDGGIDGIIYQDHLQLEKVFVQAKRYRDNKVGAGEIRDFIGALSLQGTTKGVFMTTSDFTQEAIETSVRNPHNKIVLINGKRLTDLAIQFNVGIQIKDVLEIKEIDNDFFE